MKSIRVLLVDDHQLVRAGIQALLRGLAGVEVVAEASDGREAQRLIAVHHPDIVLMDIMMPGMNGLEATARIVKEHPGTRVIMLSVNATEEYVLQSLRAGAAGYLLKNITPAELETAIRAVARGERYLTTAVSRHVIDAYLERVGPEASSLDRLTPRQREVLQLVAEGATTKEIGRKLGVSVKTAEMHRSQLMEALGIHDVAGLVRYAIRMGVIAPDV
ncbi:MAG TPA: response regulator transcription factor [Gemmataceae bacterium]|jgi:DNA-binding NarL/FixJ family response regulator